jgi:BlaI family penicillinase repressor
MRYRQTVCLGIGGDWTMKIDRVTDGEMAVLEVIWKRGDPTSRDIAHAIYDEVTDSKLASVQKLLERLEAKGCVSRDRRERAHRFAALVSREEILADRLRSLADQVCEGSLAPLATALLRSGDFSAEDRDRLRRLIDELWPDDGGSGRRPPKRK